MKKQLFLIFLVLSLVSLGQERYYADPLKIPLFLSASFAELRSNHFHSGIDIKTQGTVGWPVLAVADGFISRISVSPTGFGNALYIDHPNGTTSVYGHLESFAPEIQKYVKEQQYKEQSFRVDLELPSWVFLVEKGEEIAKSGNSGSSGGPHLHFEIRDTRSEEPMNPLDFGFSVADHTAPKLVSLLVVPLTDTSGVDGEASPKSFPLVMTEKGWRISGNPRVATRGPVGFAIQANDYFDGSSNPCGINRLSLAVDGIPRFAFSLDRFSFDDSRYINSHIVYEEYVDSKRRYIKTWCDPGNRLPVYSCDFSGGIVTAGKEGNKIRIQIEDSYGNPAALEFNVVNSSQKTHKIVPASAQLMSWNKSNEYTSENCVLEIPEGALYKDFWFSYREDPASDTYYSEFQRISSNRIPLHKVALLRIKARNLPAKLQSKVLVANFETGDGRPVPMGGSYQNGWVETEIHSLGMYALMVDTLAPEIVPLSLSDGKLTESSRIRFKVTDDLSGIKNIEGRIDGKWALFECDAKNSRIAHYFDPERFELGKRHTFTLLVTDLIGNESVYETSFWK